MKKLFYDNALQGECKANVTKIEGKEIQVDQSVFFAFSGGQASDSGTIAGINVLEARKDGETIIYVLETDPDFEVSSEVEIKIDLEKRKKLMKMHSALHIAHALFEEKVGKQEAIGSNVDPEKARIDYAYDKPIGELLPELQEKENALIAEGVEVKTYEDPDEPGRRVWECGEWKIPCGGTHVSNTKEIGKIKLKRKNIGKGKERIEITLQ